jgi:hypothetical protein
LLPVVSSSRARLPGVEVIRIVAVPAHAGATGVRARPLEVPTVSAAARGELALEGATHDVDGLAKRDERRAQVGRRRFAVGAALDRLDNASVGDEHNAGGV